MSDPLSEKVQGYNTNPRPRPRRRFRPFAAPESLEGYYSPFWPLLIIFLAFIVLLVFEITSLRYKTVSFRAQLLRLSDGLQKAKVQADFIQGLRADITALAATDPAAAALQKEFFPATPAAPPAEIDPIEAPKTPEK